MFGSRCFGYKGVIFSGLILLALVCTAQGQSATSGGAAKQIKSPSRGAVRKNATLAAVPAVVGKTRAAAELLLKKSGFRAGTVHYGASIKAKPDTVTRQEPAAGKMAAKGSKVDLWLQKPMAPAIMPSAPGKSASIKPKLHTQQKKLLMAFPQRVSNVVVYDSKGKVLQRFHKGQRFDLTQSLIKTNAGRITVGFDPDPDAAVPRISYHRPEDHPERMAFNLDNHYRLASRYITIDDDRTIERNEPGNDTITGAARITAGFYSGVVGGDDATDYLKAVSNSRGFGTLVEVRVESGDVELHLYDPVRAYQVSDRRKAWIALTPGTTFYVQVSPTGAGSTDYRLRISYTTIDDAYENNDTDAMAKNLGTQRAFLGNVINSAGSHVGVSDWYKSHLAEPQHLRLEVTNAGLASGDQVHILLYQPAYPAPDASNEGSSDPVNISTAERGVLQVDLRSIYEGHPFPTGDWRILVTTATAGAGSPEAFGTGDPPACYTRTTGYALTKTVLP